LAPLICRTLGITTSCRLLLASRSHRGLEDAIRSLAGTLLPTVFIVGGSPSAEESGLPVVNVDTISPSTNRWEPLPGMSIGRTGCTAVVVQGSLYIMGGSNGMAAVADCEFLNLTDSTKKWESLPKMSVPRFDHRSIAVGGRIFVVDGLQDADDPGVSNQAYISEQSGVSRCEYLDIDNPLEPSFKPWTATPSAEKVKAAIALKRKVYLAGMKKGIPTEGDLLFCEYFDPETGDMGESEQAGPLPEPPFKDVEAATSLRDNIFLFGKRTKQMCILNTLSGVWEVPTGQPPIRMRTIKVASAGVPAGQLLCFGQFASASSAASENGEKNGKRAEPAAGPCQPWVLLPPLQAGRSGAAVALVTS